MTNQVTILNTNNLNSHMVSSILKYFQVTNDKTILVLITLP